MQILQWVKKQTGKLADNVKDYKFYVKSQPNFIDSSTTLVLTPYENRDQITTIPCTYKWSKIKNGFLSQVPQFKGNSFFCQPSDIGSLIQAQVTSTDSTHPGTAILIYGPVKLDILIKKQVQHTLASGSAVMNIDLTNQQQIKQCQIKITEETIKIWHSNSNNQYTFDYSLGQPRIETSPRQPDKVIIHFNQKYEAEVTKFTSSIFSQKDNSEPQKQLQQKTLQLKFQNRAIKDGFLLIIKAFNTKKAMKTSSILTKVQNIDINQNQNFNYILQIQSLKSDLIKFARLNDKYISDKKMCFDQNRKLQKQIQDIIVTYTKIVQNKCKSQNQLDLSIMQLRQKKDEVMQKKMDSLLKQNKMLKNKLQQMNDDINSKPSHSPKKKQQQLNQSRGPFYKKNTVQQIQSDNHHYTNNILDNLNQQKNYNNKTEDVIKLLKQQKIILAKKLNQSVIKVVKLQSEIKELKLNQTALNQHNISNASQANTQSNKKHNRTDLNINTQEYQKFCAQLEEIQNKNKPKKINSSQLIQPPTIISPPPTIISPSSPTKTSQPPPPPLPIIQSQIILQSTKQKQPINPQLPLSQPKQQNISEQKQHAHNKRIEQLTQQNIQLKQQIQLLIIEKDVILKQKSNIQNKYKKRVSNLAQQNSIYKRNQDALNRSQNLSLQMDNYNQQQMKQLKQKNQTLSNQNVRLNKLCIKLTEQNKQIPKLKDQIAKLTTELTDFKKQKLPLQVNEAQINPPQDH